MFRSLLIALLLQLPFSAHATEAQPLGEPGWTQTGKASYYSSRLHGRRTASGEPYDETDLTAAHPALPFGTLVEVTNTYNGRSVIVRINDRGPFVGHRIIDVSQRAAEELGMIRAGSARVRLNIPEPESDE
ncbi:MAG: septal ring lytic transglycosylase RlpA family protein [Pseudomonadaceae bacterium]